MTKTLQKPSSLPPRPADPINPFTAVTSGFSRFFSFATGPAMLLTVITGLSILYSLVNYILDAINPRPAPAISAQSDFSLNQIIFALLVVFVIALLMTLIGTMLKGIQSYGMVAAARGEKVTLSDAFNATLNNFGTFFILYIWMNVRIFAWTLLFIVPGIVAYYRFSFAPLLFFDKELRHEHALKESSRLTRGGLMTIFGSQTLFNMVTLGQLSLLVESAGVSQLYKIYTELDQKGEAKPAVHALSWLALGLTIALIIALMLLFMLLLVIIAADISKR